MARASSSLIPIEQRHVDIDAGSHLEPFGALAVCIEDADEGEHPRTFPPRARGCRFNGQFRGADIRPRRQGILQPTRRRLRMAPHRRPRTTRGCSCSGTWSRPSSAASVSRARSRSCSYGAANDIGPRGVGSWRPRFQVADVAGAKPCVGNVGEPPRQLRILGRQSQASIRRDGVRMRRPDLRDEGERIPHEPFANGLRIETGRGNARRTLHQRVEGILQRELQLLGSEREEQREDGIPQQSRFRKISARDAQVDERRLEGGLFQSAMATASSCVRPSARLTSGGSGAPPSRRIPAVSVRARMAASTIGWCRRAIHRCASGADDGDGVTSTRVIILHGHHARRPPAPPAKAGSWAVTEDAFRDRTVWRTVHAAHIRHDFSAYMNE